jgi:hypothetical protein
MNNKILIYLAGMLILVFSVHAAVPIQASSREVVVGDSIQVIVGNPGNIYNRDVGICDIEDNCIYPSISWSACPYYECTGTQSFNLLVDSSFPNRFYLEVTDLSTDPYSVSTLHIRVVEEPIQQEPIQQEPIQQEPIQQEPIQQEPIQQEPIQQEPIQQEPIHIISDSDLGYRKHTKGYTSGYNILGDFYSHEDYCDPYTNFLMEGLIDVNCNIRVVEAECPGACEYGACTLYEPDWPIVSGDGVVVCDDIPAHFGCDDLDESNYITRSISTYNNLVSEDSCIYFGAVSVGLMEYTCDNNMLVKRFVKCNCDNGKCI